MILHPGFKYFTIRLSVLIGRAARITSLDTNLSRDNWSSMNTPNNFTQDIGLIVYPRSVGVGDVGMWGCGWVVGWWGSCVCVCLRGSLSSNVYKELIGFQQNMPRDSLMPTYFWSTAKHFILISFYKIILETVRLCIGSLTKISLWEYNQCIHKCNQKAKLIFCTRR